MSDTRKDRGNMPETNRPAQKQADVSIQQPDLKGAAAELGRRVEDIKRLVAGIQEAKTVSQKLLRMEVSI